MNIAIAPNPREVIGGNNPPEPTPFELVEVAIDDLSDEARLWLDGEPVTTQEQADALNTLESKIRKAAKDAEELRKIEAKPFDDGKAEVQARYNPLIAKDKGKTDMAISAVKSALKPYLLELERKQQEAARLAREEATRKQEEAFAAMRQRDAANLAQREEAERLVAEAKAADEAARKAENAKAHAKGDGRATGLRTVHRAVMTDPHEAAAWVWKDCNAELLIFVQDLADKAVLAGKRQIRGFNVVKGRVL